MEKNGAGFIPEGRNLGQTGAAEVFDLDASLSSPVLSQSGAAEEFDYFDTSLLHRLPLSDPLSETYNIYISES